MRIMAEKNAAIVINRRISRPSADLVEQLRNTPSTNAVYAMNSGGALDYRIKPVGKHSEFVGPALTIDAGPRDNLAVWAALEVAKPGDVLIIATGDHVAHSVIGDVFVTMAKNCGCVAIVTDGVVCDIPGIDATGVPVFARGLSPNSCWKNGPGEVGMRVALGGVSIESGDVIVGDSDGVAVIPAPELQAVVTAMPKIKAKEAEMENKAATGGRNPVWLAEIFAAKGIRYLD
jgi:4-hydroxy-4-methyl-2-oxoglutarate aldolase